MKKDPNIQSQHQFRGPAPQQPVDEWNRAYRKEPSDASQRARNSLSLGSQSQARPGMAGKQDFKRKPKKRG
jgi:hypothetical protein